MKPLYVLAAVMALAVATGGCKKREPKPAPQVVSLAVPAPLAPHAPLMPAAQAAVPAVPIARPGCPGSRATTHKPGGIAWFQGSLEEGFSKAAAADIAAGTAAMADTIRAVGPVAQRLVQGTHR